ncbi:MAG TPA: DNA-binding transcriptional regulator [Verrucomicrobiae bacterium]|jgi:LacI family transcriptional regulator
MIECDGIRREATDEQQNESEKLRFFTVDMAKNQMTTSSRPLCHRYAPRLEPNMVLPKLRPARPDLIHIDEVTLAKKGTKARRQITDMKNNLLAGLKQRRVAVLADFSHSYARRILMGVARFLREHREWSVQSEEWRRTDKIPAWFQNWKGEGAIVLADAPELDAVIQGLRVPVVYVRDTAPTQWTPLVDTDNRMVAHLVAEHLMGKYGQHYAFCGFVGANYSDKRSQFFRERLEQVGITCSIYEPPEVLRDLHALEFEKRSLPFQDHLDHWLRSLPKPVSIMACNDIRGQQVVSACRRLNLAIPEVVAVIGVDNDEIFCELSDPQLSSVALNTLRIGYEAANILDRMMSGMKPPAQPILIPPLGIISRRSSDVLSTDNPQMATGVRFLREHFFHSIGIKEVARVAGMSRRKFERMFADQFSRSPKAEILRLRLEYAKKLLAETNWTLDEVADKAGFNSAAYLHAVFIKKCQMTPREFRKSTKL